MVVIKFWLRIVFIWLSISISLIGIRTADAGPFADFFNELRHAFTHPERKSSSHRTPKRKPNEEPPHDESRNEPTPAPTNAPPSERNTRTTTTVATSKAAKRDLAYGLPVPGKKGLVTSPFAPESGYIDVGGFPPGTPVKDPYTGKIFLTP
jgi:hypothetical protein